ncbi:MAG: sensor histidine kinase [Sphingobacteriales bacterium]|nr:MAG: sensor histidine kinase [Sphingobacteriales bacterium]
MEKISNETGLIISVTLFLLIICSFFLFFLFLYQKKQTSYRYQTQLLQTQFSQTLLQTQLEIQEQTLKNISQEIHDNIGQVLSLAKLNINTMSGASAEVLEEKITTSKELISKAIQDLRDLSRSLNTDYIIEVGVISAVAYEMDLMSKAGVCTTKLTMHGDSYRLEPNKELIIFRIVQEVFHNIIKHAKAKHITTNVHFTPTIFEMVITDDGIGFDANTITHQNGKGLGLRNMHNRAAMIGGQFHLTSTLQQGTTVVIALPVSTNKTD